MTPVRCACGAPSCRLILAGPRTVFLCERCPAPKPVDNPRRVVTVPT